MKVVTDKKAFASACETARQQGLRVGIVPTMGALHAGHTSLIDTAKTESADFVAITIFVNPLQFGEHDDLSAYPRTLEADIAICERHGVGVVFAPDPTSMYDADFSTLVRVDGLTPLFEGEFRPDHFSGVTTIVAKLFNLTGPCIAVFGRKDYQQWRTVARMVRDLDMPVEVYGAPIVREHDGLALSSRNIYLSPDQRARALSLREGLLAIKAAWTSGNRNLGELIEIARAPIAHAFDKIDYIDAVDPDTLAPLTRRGVPTGTDCERPVILATARMGKTRLLDNIELAP